MEDALEYVTMFLNNKDFRKLLPVIKLFAKDPVVLALIAGVEFACTEFDKGQSEPV